jgi:hypothetical protein
LADVAELLGQLQQANLGPDHLAFCGQVDRSRRVGIRSASPKRSSDQGSW